MTNQPIPEHPIGDEIRLFDSIRPPLSQGQFDVKIQQSFPAVVDGVSTGMSEQSQIRRIEVGGSRWSIDPLCVHSRTPPRNEQNVRLDMTLPKIVFQKKTLPWERTVDSSNEDAPWMGLLLLREDEFEDGYCEILKDATSHDILGSTSGPLIQVQALRITEKLLKAVGPYKASCNYLPMVCKSIRRIRNCAVLTKMACFQLSWQIVSHQKPTRNIMHALFRMRVSLTNCLQTLHTLPNQIP